MNRSGRIDDDLTQVPLFQGLSKAQLRVVSSLGTRITGAPGKVLLREGRPGNEFIILLDGEVEVSTRGHVLATREHGDFLGEIALLGARPRTATAVATSPVTVDVMSRQEFWSLLNEAPELSDRLYHAMTERLTGHAITDEQVTPAL